MEAVMLKNWGYMQHTILSTQTGVSHMHFSKTTSEFHAGP